MYPCLEKRVFKPESPSSYRHEKAGEKNRTKTYDKPIIR